MSDMQLVGKQSRGVLSWLLAGRRGGGAEGGAGDASHQAVSPCPDKQFKTYIFTNHKAGWCSGQGDKFVLRRENWGVAITRFSRVRYQAQSDVILVDWWLCLAGGHSMDK